MLAFRRPRAFSRICHGERRKRRAPSCQAHAESSAFRAVIGAIDDQGLVEEFRTRFGADARLFSAPGRVNLIGEHTDYNDGFVLPMAIDGRTYVAGARRGDRRVRVYSHALSESHEFDLDVQPGPPSGKWHAFVEGTIRTLAARGLQLHGADLSITSTVPSGAGLSASAALEVSVGYAVLCLSGHASPDRLSLALSAQRAEHDYVGTRCGIMDQYISASALPEHALLIDCRSLESRPVPMMLGSRRIVICDTRVRHELASSEYNLRRSECEEGVSLLSRALPGISALRDVTEEDLARHGAALPPVIARRCRHVVSENARTLAAADALAAQDFERLGALMTASHRSLRDDYQVSCPELDFAVDTALSVSGVYGSRMTGGGFGGCTVTVADAEAVSQVSERMKERFERELGRGVSVFSTTAREGAREHSIGGS